MSLSQGVFPYYPYLPVVPSTDGSDKGKEEKPKENVFAQEQAKLDEEAKNAQDEFLKRLELIKLKAEHKKEIEDIQATQENAENTYIQFLKSKNDKGEGRLDSGNGGLLRWLSNAGTSLLNLGKSIIGFDKDGKWNPLKCLKNVVITAAAIGACFIPYVGPYIGYGLLATGVAGSAVGIAKGVKNLNEAERLKDQAKIDEAQQDICGNAFIGITSALGLKGIGSSFRTSAATAELASSAATRTGMAGRTAEALSNFGRDVTVNALRSTKYSASNGAIPSLMRFKGWDKQYRYQSRKMYETLNNKIVRLDEQILAETDMAKRVLLQEQKQMLEANLSELSKIGGQIKSKADFDKLASDNMAQFNEEYVQSAFSDSEGILGADGNMVLSRNVNGTLIKEQEFLNFERMIIRQQRAIDNELKALVKAKENMMRTYAKHADKHRAELERYLSTDGALTIGGKNPKFTRGWFRYAMTSPASTAPKAMGMWVDPLYSGAALYTVDLSKDDTQTQLETMQRAINSIKSVREQMENASTAEEFNQALTEYNKLLLAASGETAPLQNDDNQEQPKAN